GESGVEEEEAAEDRGQKSGNAIGERLVKRRVHAENGGGVLILPDGEKSEPELRRFDEVAQEQGRGHHRNSEEVDGPQRLSWPAERLINFERKVNSRRAAPRFEIGDEGFDRLVDADRGQREKSPAQAQNAEPKDQREQTHRNAGNERGRGERP